MGGGVDDGVDCVVHAGVVGGVDGEEEGGVEILLCIFNRRMSR